MEAKRSSSSSSSSNSSSNSNSSSSISSSISSSSSSKRSAAFFLLLVLVLQRLEQTSSVGINYGRLGDNLPTPEQVVALLTSNNITKARIFDADAAVLKAFAKKSIQLSISVPNEQLQSLAASQDAAKSWLNSNYAPYATSVSIPAISVGNEVLVNNDQFSSYLLPAMKNIASALKSFSAPPLVSTPHAFSVLSNTSFPPSKGTFTASIAETSMRPILDFLSASKYPFMVNVYPFFSYAGDPNNVPLDYALFGEQASGINDGSVHYSNLFDAMVDTVVSALSAMGYSGMDVVVTESGWPSVGSEPGAPLRSWHAAAAQRHPRDVHLCSLQRESEDGADFGAQLRLVSPQRGPGL